MANAQSWIVYQPLIVGFGAVALGLLANSALEWFRQSLIRRNEARALRAALIAELSANLRNLQDRFQNKNSAGPGQATTNLLVPLGAHTAVYDGAIARLGLLKASEIGPVIRAYDFLVNGPKPLCMIGTMHGDGYFRWLDISIRYETTIKGLDDATSTLIVSAIDALSGAGA